ncbi:hypothetical protein GCM10027612_03630 [Microbispora bryophytorum subsp. camponoti]
MSNLVMVMPYRAFVIKAREEGHRICAVWDPALQTPDYLAGIADLADAFVLTDFADPVAFDRTVRQAVRDFDADLVYHIGAEESMLATYRIAEDLGKAVNPARSIELLNDKLQLRRLLAEHDLSPVRFAHAARWQDVRPCSAASTSPLSSSRPSWPAAVGSTCCASPARSPNGARCSTRTATAARSSWRNTCAAPNTAWSRSATTAATRWSASPARCSGRRRCSSRPGTCTPRRPGPTRRRWPS